MPALRNRKHLISETSNINGISASNGNKLLKKKLVMLEDKLNNDISDMDNNNNCANNNNQSDGEEIYGDAQTIGSHPKRFVGKSTIADEKIPIFTDQNNEQQQQQSNLFGPSIKDQFATALLRLQHDLDATNEKLNDIETKLDSISKRNLNNSRQSNWQQTSGSSSKKGFLNKNNIYTLMYFGWPVVVFIAMRALEKKSLSNGRLAQ